MSDKKLHIEDELKEAVTIGLLVELIEKLKGEKEQLQEVVSGSTIHQAPERKIIESQLGLLNEILDLSKPRLSGTYIKHEPIAVEIYTRVLNVQNELLDRLYEIPVSTPGDWSDMGNAID